MAGAQAGQGRRPRGHSCPGALKWRKPQQRRRGRGWTCHTNLQGDEDSTGADGKGEHGDHHTHHQVRVQDLALQGRETPAWVPAAQGWGVTTPCRFPTPTPEPHAPAPHHRLAHLVWQWVRGLSPSRLQASLLQLGEELASNQRPGAGEKSQGPGSAEATLLLWALGSAGDRYMHGHPPTLAMHRHTHTNAHMRTDRHVQAPTRARWGHCSDGSGGRTVPPGGHRRPRRGRGRAAPAKESGERTHAGQGRWGKRGGRGDPSPMGEATAEPSHSPVPTTPLSLSMPAP